MDRLEGFGKSTPLNPRLRNRWVYKRSSWQRKATYNCGLYYRRWTSTWSSLDIFYTKKVKKYDFPPVESAVPDEKAREMQKIQKQNDHMKKIYRLQPQLRINGKKKVAISFLSTISKKDDEVKVGDENMTKKLVF